MPARHADVAEHDAGKIGWRAPPERPDAELRRTGSPPSPPISPGCWLSRRLAPYRGDDQATRSAHSDRGASRREVGREQRRALSPAGTAAAAGRRDLHPRGLHPVASAGFRLLANAERHLRPPGRNGAPLPRACPRPSRAPSKSPSAAVSLDELRYEYPEETARRASPAQDALVRLTWEGAGGGIRAAFPTRCAAALDARTGAHPKLLRGLFSHGLGPGAVARSAASSARDAARRPTRPSVSAWASPPSIRSASTCCSSVSSARNATRRPTSTSISSTNGARR